MISFTSKPRISGLVAVIVLLGVPFSTTGGRVLATATPYNVLYEFTGNKNCPNSNDDVTTQPPYATFSPLTMVGVICDKPSDDHRSSSWAQTAFRGTGQYLSFTVSATTGHSLSFAASDVMGFMSSITVNGPTDGEVFCSVDGQAFQSMGFFLTNSLVILPMPKVVKASSVEFRFYAWKAAAANGVLILDNITVAGSTSPVNSTGMAIWRRSGSSAPRYNTWDGSTFGTAANSANVGEWRNLAAAAAPTRDEVIVVGVDAAGDITGQMWDGNAWTPIPFNPLANSSFSDYVLFDVAYESQSGDAVLAWGNGTGGGSSVSYAVWNGAVWLLPADIGISVMGETRHLRLAAHPNNDEMVLVANNDAGAGASFAVVWDGSTWGNAQLLSNPSAGVTDLCVAYEPQRGNAMAVYGKSGFTVNAYYRVWNGANWTSEDSVVVTGGVSFPPQSLKLGSDPASNRIALGASTYGGAGRVWLSIWDGNLWEPTTVIGTVGTEAPVAVGFIGDSGEAMVAHRTNTSTQVAYRTWTSGGGWSGAQSGPELGDDATSLTLSPHPLYDRLMLSAQDAARNMTYVQWDGTSWGTPSQQEVDTGETLTRPFAFVWTPAPPYNPPSVVAAIADTTVDEDSPPLDDYRDLNDVFSDSEDGDSLSFTIQSNSNSGLVIAAIDPSDSTLDLALVPDRRGVATIIIRATDSSAGFVEDTLVVTVVAADMQMATGRHLGNGIAGWPIANVGFQPDVVFIKGDNTDPTVVRTSTMVGDAAKELGPNNALTSNLIMSLDADGFTIGSNQQVNSAGVTYYWVAFKAATGEMVVDTYPGLGGDDRSIPGVGFTPEYVIVMNEGGAVAMQRFSAQVGDNSLPFASSDPRPDRIQALEADGFQVGQHNTVNEGGQTFHYVAWKTVPGRIAGSLHLGTGGDDHDMNGVGFQPDFLIISAQGNVSPTAHRPSSLGGDNTLLVDDVTFNDGVQTFLPDGFQLGQDDAVNRAGEIYFWVAFNSVETLDLALRKTVLDTTANEGDTLSYSVVVANRGPEAATGVVLTDLLPAGVSYLANSASQGPYTDSTGVWSVGGIANGDSATLTLTATVDSGTGGSIITNTAAITAVDQLDSLSANDTDTATVTVQSVDLETVKSVDITTPDEGDTISYTVIVSNNGPDDAAMLQLSDTLPTAVTYISHSASNGNYNFASGQWNINSLPNGDADTLTITASIDVETAGTTIMNTVAIDFAEQADPNPTNDIDSVAVVVASADVALTKTVSPVVTNEGDTITYMITVSNSGPQSAPSVAVADTLPTGVTYVTSTSSQGSYDVGTGVWTVGSVDSATSDTLAVTAIINAGVAGSTISNWAAITTTGRGDPDGSNDADTVSIDVTSADLAVAKTVDTGAPAEGDTVAYTIMVSNAGPDTATGIEITDSLPVGLTYVSQMTTQGNYDSTTGVWAIANVANAASDTLILIVAVDAGTGGSTINNTAAVTQADVGDPDASNNSDTAGINVNDGPVVASAIPDTTVSEDSAPVGNYRDLNDVFTDVEDGRTLAFLIDSNSDTALVTVTVDADSALDLSFAPGQSGSATIGVRATDTGSISVVDTFVVTVTAVNDSPMVVAAIPDTTVDEDNPPIDNYRDLNDVFADIEDGNALSFAMQSNSDSSLVAVVIDADSAVDLTFAADQNGSATIVFRATDSGGFSVDDTLVVTVSPTNDPPTVTSAIPDTTVIQDNAPIDSYRDLNEVFSDIEDGPSLNFAIQGNTNPALVNAIIDADSALDLSFTPGLNGTATITIRAIDSGGLFAQDTLVVAVKQKPSLIDVAGSLYPNSAFVNDPQLALRIGVDNTSATGITLATTTRVFFSDGINDYWATLTNPTYVPANATNFTLTFSSTAVPSGIAAPDFYDLRLDLNGADDNSFSHTDTVWTTGRNSIFVDTPKIRLSALPLDVETVFPGQRDATILLLDLQNGYADDRFLDSLIIFNTSLGSGSAAQLDGEIEVIRLFDDVDSSRALSAADTLVASSSFDANTALFSIAGSWRVPGSSHRTLIATAHVDSFLATDGDHLDVALLSAADIVFQGNTLVADDFSPLYPADSFGRLVIDGMVPHQISITASAVDTLESGTTDNWVVTLVAPQNGYQVDTLMALAIKNYAADFSPSDISAWHLYQDTGDGVFDPVTDASLGQMVYSGDLIEISGLNQPIVTDLTLFITADVALDATDGDHFQPGIPINGIEVVSANDGPNNVPVVLTKSFTIRRLQKIDIANLPLSPYSPHPGDGDAPLLLLAIGNNTLMNVQLDTLTLTNATTGVGTGTDLDNTFLDVKIIEDDGDGVVDATDNVVREGLTFVGGSVTVTGLGLSFTPGATKHLLIAAHFDSSCSSDGDTVSVRVPSPSSLGFDQPLSKVGTFPMATPTPLVLDGMMAHQISVAPSADSLLISAGMDVLLFDFAVPANGYQIDTLQSIHIQNLGSANSEHFARLALYRDGGNGTFDAGIGDDSYLGDFVEDPTQPGGRDYDITGLSDPLVNTCGNLARYFVVSDITSDYTVGGSIQFAIPIQGLQLASANDGPIDQSVQDPSIQVLPKPDQLTIFPYSVSDQTVYPGSTKNLNFGVGFYNGYTFPLQLQQLKVFQAGTAASTEIDSVFAYADIDSNGLFDPVADSLVAVVASSGISYTLSQLDLQLAPQQISYVFISYDLSLSIRDSVTVDLKMFDVDGISVNPAGTDIQGEFPVNSPGVDTSDGMIARQILLHPVPVVRAAPGDADVLVLAMTVPPNGILPDVLDFVSIGNLGSASPGADIALVRLWKESGGDANNFDPADDDMLTTLNWNGTTWTNPGALGEIIPLAATRLYVTFSVSNAPSDGATLRASVPLNGIQVASGNDGPIDAFIANPTEQSVSTDPLITSLTTDLGSYSVGQAMSLVMSVRNEGVDTLLGITPSAISVLGSAAVSLSSGPTPISLDLLPGADSVFVWNYVTNAAGDIHFCGYAHSGDSLFVSQETCSQDAQVQNRASAIPTSLSNFAPATANRGQDNVTMFKLKLTYDDFDSLSAAVELDGLRLVIEDEAGNPIPPNTVVDRLSFLAAGGINYSFSLIDSTSNPLQLYVPTPIVIPASDSLVLNITCDVGENAAFVAYRVSVAAPGDIRVADRNDGLPVPLSSGESFPWSTTSVVLNQSADSLLVSSDTSSTLSANTGQDDVRLFSLSMLNRGDANAASVIVTDMTLEFFDSTGAPLPPDQAIRALHAVSNGQTLFTTQIIPDGDNTLSMNLGTPLILAPGVLEYLDIVVDLSAVPQTGSFYSTVAAPSSVVARDINTAQIVGTYAMNPSIADFPFASNRIFFETPASALLASFVDRMPPSILPSTFGAPVADLALGHVDSAMSSSLVLDSLAVLFTDASSGPIFPGDYFSKVYVVHGADTLSQVTSLSSTQPIAECKLLPPIVIAPAETDTISVLVDTKAVFAPTVFEVWLDRQHLVVFDQNDGSRMLGISGTFPFVAGPATLQLPSTQVAAGLASRLPQNVATREAGVQAFDLLLRNGNPPGHTTVALQSLAVNIRDAKGNTLEPSKLLSGARLLKADSLIAVGQLNGGNVTFLFAGSAPLVPAAAVDTLSLEVDVDAQMSDVNFQFVIADGNAIRLTDVVTGDTLTTATINNIGFPLRSTFTHILGNSPEAAFTNYPNPFAAGKQGTRITYKLAQTATVTLKLYTVWGNHVRTLIDNKTQSPGLYQDVAWDGQNADGDVVNNGVYFLILEIHGANGSHAKFRRKVGVVR